MSTSVEFYFDYGSPTTYLAWTQLPRICKQHDAELVYKPMLLGGVFRETGNASPITIEAKGDWMKQDLARFAQRYNVPFLMNPFFMINTLPIMRGVFWARREGVFDTYNRAMFQAMWVDGIDMNDPKEIGRVVSEAGLDAAALGEAIQQPEIKKDLIEATNEATKRGVFGAPTFFVGGVMHFGQDRLDWVAEALSRDRVTAAVS